MRTQPTIIVLAAGHGARFLPVRHRLAQPLEAGTVLGSTLAQALQTGLPVLAVCSLSLAPLAAAALPTRDLLVLDDAQAARGMGHGMALAVAERAGAAGWLVLPGDLPQVRSQSLLRVAAALQQHPVAYAQHRGRRGHPVGFAAELYSELVRLDGDEGVRRLLGRYPAAACEVDDPGVLTGPEPPDLARRQGPAGEDGAPAAAAVSTPVHRPAGEPAAARAG